MSSLKLQSALEKHGSQIRQVPHPQKMGVQKVQVCQISQNPSHTKQLKLKALSEGKRKNPLYIVQPRLKGQTGFHKACTAHVK